MIQHLKLSLINELDEENDNNSLLRNARTYAVECIEIKQRDSKYILLHEKIETELFDQDQILLNGILLKVNLINKSPLLNNIFIDEDDNYQRQVKENEFQYHASQSSYLPTPEKHPLDFLFNKNINCHEFD